MLHDYYTDDYKLHSPARAFNRDEIKTYFAAFRESFTDFMISRAQILLGGNPRHLAHGDGRALRQGVRVHAHRRHSRPHPVEDEACCLLRHRAGVRLGVRARRRVPQFSSARCNLGLSSLPTPVTPIDGKAEIKPWTPSAGSRAEAAGAATVREGLRGQTPRLTVGRSVRAAARVYTATASRC